MCIAVIVIDHQLNLNSVLHHQQAAKCNLKGIVAAHLTDAMDSTQILPHYVNSADRQACRLRQMCMLREQIERPQYLSLIDPTSGSDFLTIMSLQQALVGMPQQHGCSRPCWLRLSICTDDKNCDLKGQLDCRTCRWCRVANNFCCRLMLSTS